MLAQSHFSPHLAHVFPQSNTVISNLARRLRRQASPAATESQYLDESLKVLGDVYKFGMEELILHRSDQLDQLSRQIATQQSLVQQMGDQLNRVEEGLKELRNDSPVIRRLVMSHSTQFLHLGRRFDEVKRKLD